MTTTYEDETCRLIRGSVPEALDGLGRFDLIATDPPYGIGAAYDGERELAGDEYWPWLADVVERLREIGKVVVMTHRVEALSKLPPTWDWVCPWTKPLSSGVRVGNSPLIAHWEPIICWGIHSLGVVSTVGVPDVFRFSVDRSGARAPRGRAGWATAENDRGPHPTPKPLDLMRSIVAAFGQGAETLLDPFAGSGTTLRAGKDLGLHVTGIDRSGRYLEMCRERLAQEVLV